MPGKGAAGQAVERCAAVIAAREPVVRAWAALDLDAARGRAERLDRDVVGPMSGFTLGVKDIIDTAGFPTEYGSPLYRGHRPEVDASVVTRLTAAGAVLLGKTVTAEFAGPHPGPTTNPHRATHTPGGSSMGSAAAVAAGMADLCLGTQTAASIVRPASYCGVYGFRPSFGAVPRDGVKLVSPSMDTVGWFARDPSTVALAYEVLTGVRVTTTRPRLARCPWTGETGADTRAAVDGFLTAAPDFGWVVGEDVAGAGLAELAEAQRIVMTVETAASLGTEAERPDCLSAELLAVLAEANRITGPAREAAYATMRRARAEVAVLFGSADLLVAPAAFGEAPEGLADTGNPLFARPWSLLGLPSLTVPWSTGATGLPVGVQLVGRPGGDAMLLGAAQALPAVR
jgi:Asp-tRNA(Asn)/Glu-tRNA(Gln) amidotransferase A subunit family amidase